jgi:hypothetical protein
MTLPPVTSRVPLYVESREMPLHALTESLKAPTGVGSIRSAKCLHLPFQAVNLGLKTALHLNPRYQPTQLTTPSLSSQHGCL